MKAWKGTLEEERLEFLGDRALALAAAHIVLFENPAADPGTLAALMTAMTSNERLCRLALFFKVGELPAIDSKRAQKILADRMEQQIGAAYLEGGMESAVRLLQEWNSALPPEVNNPRHIVEEYCLKRFGTRPSYVPRQMKRGRGTVWMILVGGVEIGRGAKQSDAILAAAVYLREISDPSVARSGEPD